MGRTQHYGPEHQRQRRNWNAELEANGPRPCPRCDLPVYPDSRADLNPDHRKFDLGHQTAVAYGGQGPKKPEHSTCNRRAGGQLGILIKQLARRPATTREW